MYLQPRGRMAIKIILLLTAVPSLVVLGECPDGWVFHKSGGERLCYKEADIRQHMGSATIAERNEVANICKGLHPKALISMPRTPEQLSAMTMVFNGWGSDAQIIGLQSSNGVDWVWDDGKPLAAGDWTAWGAGFPKSLCPYACRHGLVNSKKKDKWWDKDNYWFNGDSGTPASSLVCQITLEWSCLDDRLEVMTLAAQGRPGLTLYDHQYHQAPGCRQVLTCSSREFDENGDLVKGLTVNLRQSSTFTVSADIDVLLEDSMLVSIAFTEGTSPSKDKDGKQQCNAESLGLFLPHTAPVLHALPLSYGHSLYGSLYGQGLYGHGVNTFYGNRMYGRFSHTHKVTAPRTMAKETSVSGGTKATFNIQKLQGFSSLKELAGRGVVVCPSASVDEQDGVMRCYSDAIPLCCEMGWALEADQQFLE